MLNRRPVRFPLSRPALMTGAALLAAASPPALAQNSQESFVPPMGNWSLPPSGQQAPAPTPAPQQTETPAQPPVIVPTITPTPAPTAQPRAPQPTPSPAPAPQQAAPAPTTEPVGEAPVDTTPTPVPDLAAPAPQPVAEATPVPGTVSEPSGGLPRWLVALVALALAGGAGWLLFHRRRRRDADEVFEADAQDVLAPMVAEEPAAPRPAPAIPIAPVPVRRVPGEVASPAVRRAVPGAPTPQPPATPTPKPTPAPAPVASDPGLQKGLITTRIPPLGRASPPSASKPSAPQPSASRTPAPPSVSAPVVPLPPPAQRPRANGGGLGFILNAQRITVSLTQLMLEFELIAENHTDVAVASLDVATSMLTAHAGQDAQIARFFAERPDSPATALEVGPQMARGLNGKLAMPLAQVNPVETGGRSYCVPIMMIDARYTWADGREERKSVAFVMGKGAQDANKLGPIFLDRGPGVTREVGARLHTPLRKAS